MASPSNHGSAERGTDFAKAVAEDASNWTFSQRGTPVFRLAFNTNGLLTLPLDRAIEEVSKAGYEGVEISLDAAHLHPYDITTARLDQLKDLFARFSIEPISLSTGGLFLLSDVPQEPSLISPDEEGRKERIRFISAALDIANYLSIPLLNFTSGTLHRDFEHENISPEEATEYLIEGVHACLRNAGDVIMVLEPEATLYSHLVETTSQAIPIIQAVDSPQFRLSADIAHVQSFERDLLRSIEEALPYMRHVSIADVKGRVHHHEIPGDGDIDFPSLFEVLRRGNYEHYLSVEVYWHPNVWETSLRRSREYLLAQMNAGDSTSASP